MTRPLPIARPLQALSPSSYEVLRTCPLRLAFSQAGYGPGPNSDVLLVGQACHDVLESLVADGLIGSGHWNDYLDTRFKAAVAAREDEKGAPLRGASLARARLRKACGRVAHLLAQVPAEAEIVTEAQLEAADGRLLGRIDLVVRSPELHLIVDYKTGVITEAGGDLKERFRRQLMLYACLEAKQHGWPDQAQLMPLGREAVDIAIEPSKCQALLEDALDALRKWQECVGRAPAAQTSPETCGDCPYAARCSPMWEALSDDWSESFVAVSGPLSALSSTPLGGITLSMHAERGTTGGEVTVRNIYGQQHPCLLDAHPGDEISLVGLRGGDEADGVYTLAPGARSYRAPQPIRVTA